VLKLLTLRQARLKSGIQQALEDKNYLEEYMDKKEE